MTTEGLIMMLVTWGIIISLMVRFYYKVFTSDKKGT